nr:glycoside hydrolase family 3 protein [Hyphomonas sp. Mor2]
MRVFLAAMTAGWLVSGCATSLDSPPSDAGPTSSVTSAQNQEDQLVSDLVSRMSLERKVAQLIQPQINSFTVEDMRRYRFGSYLNGGNGGPFGDEFAPASKWLALADQMWMASMEPLPGDEPAIPTLWGTDAVHGHTNVIGATIFPHNIALGATRDADLVRRIAHATAIEIDVTGIDWNFSPTVAIARDDRWGRTYESYSEDPQIVSELGAAFVEGLQGAVGDDDRLGDGRVLSTAKHFFGDGGTERGVDQGNVDGDLDELKQIHVVPYVAAIEAGVESIMASFNSINGRKMHGNTDLLTGVLRDELGFDGVVVGDWNGHGQVAGCTVTDCPQSLLAGLDIYMVPDDWQALLENLVNQIQDGTISEARLNDAVSRVLRMKYRAGLLAEDAPRPIERAVAQQPERLGAPEHREIAREAVAKSQVLLKNEGVLPLSAASNVLVAGTAANSIAQASGGWTLTWQGGGELTNDMFPGAHSIYDGIAAAVEAGGGQAQLSETGEYTERPDVAVIVFGEQPYAEFAGDKRDLVFRDEEGLALLQTFADDGVPTVAVFLSGRPLWMNRELNAANAFVAAWLPGSEGGGVADILFGKQAPTGRLSFSWPVACAGIPVNSLDGALFPVGYGLSFTDDGSLTALDESCSNLVQAASLDWFSSGRMADGVTVSAGSDDLPQMRGTSPLVSIRGLDRAAQEDAREIAFQAGGGLTITGPGKDEAYRIAYRIVDRPTGEVSISSGGDQIDATGELAVAAGKGWREMVLTKSCLPTLNSELRFQSEDAFELQIHSIVREDLDDVAECAF